MSTNNSTGSIINSKHNTTSVPGKGEGSWAFHGPLLVTKTFDHKCTNKFLRKGASPQPLSRPKQLKTQALPTIMSNHNSAPLLAAASATANKLLLHISSSTSYHQYIPQQQSNLHGKFWQLELANCIPLSTGGFQL